MSLSVDICSYDDVEPSRCCQSVLGKFLHICKFLHIFRTFYLGKLCQSLEPPNGFLTACGDLIITHILVDLVEIFPSHLLHCILIDKEALSQSQFNNSILNRFFHLLRVYNKNIIRINMMSYK